MEHTEIAIIGAGIAGASVAYHLVHNGCSDLTILEKEYTPGYHASGRSAAVLTRMSEDELFMRLSVLSTPFLQNPPQGFSEAPVLRQNGLLTVGNGTHWHAFRMYARVARRLGISSVTLSPRDAVHKVPALEERFIHGGIFYPDDGILDIHAILWGYLRGAKNGGARLVLDTEVTGINVEKGRVRGIATTRGEIACTRVINAAGPWANEIAGMAGARPMPLTPYRRHIIIAKPSPDLPIGDWPMTRDLSRRFYFRPESGAILASPMDQDPMEPCDATTDELRIAQTADLLSRFTPKIAPQMISNTWAGLRTICADRAPVVGEDPEISGLFWLAGQGGHGIHTSPALGRIAAEILTRGSTELIDTRLISPARFRWGRLSWPPIILHRTGLFLQWLIEPGKTKGI